MKIIGISKERSTFGAGIGKKYLQLSELPSVSWTRECKRVHDSTVSPKKRKLIHYEVYLIVECPDDEIQVQIDFLNEICFRTDEQLLAISAEELQREQRLAEELVRKGRLADEVIKNLKFP